MEDKTHVPSTTEELHKRELVQRVCEAPGFRNAPRIRAFFLFVTDLALSGRSDEITEQRIGHEVFHRPADYDTSNDNNVRVSARQLRSKLREYFDAEGRDEIWRIEIPKGAYVPIFEPRIQALAPELQASGGSERHWRIAAIAFGLSTLALAGLALSVWVWNRPHGAELHSIVDPVLRPTQRTLIVLADSSMVFLQQFTGKTLTVEEYSNREYLRNPDAKTPGERAILTALSAAQLTSVADMGVAVRVIRMRSDMAKNIEVVHARSVTARNLKEDNLLLIGGPRSNPWVSLFEDKLNFRFSFSNPSLQATIVNRHPREGEAPNYLPGAESDADRKSYARVALVPNLSGNRSVMLISGGTIEATEAAAEFVLSPRSPELVLAALGLRAFSDTVSFELLLETSAAGGAAKNAHIIAHRLYHN